MDLSILIIAMSINTHDLPEKKTKHLMKKIPMGRKNYTVLLLELVGGYVHVRFLIIH